MKVCRGNKASANEPVVWRLPDLLLPAQARSGFLFTCNKQKHSKGGGEEDEEKGGDKKQKSTQTHTHTHTQNRKCTHTHTQSHTLTHTQSHTITHNHTHTITLSHTLSHTIQTHRFVEEKPVWSSVSTPHTVAKKEGSNALAHRCCQKKGKGLRLWIITWYVCQLSTLTLFGSASAGWMNGVVYVQTFFFFFEQRVLTAIQPTTAERLVGSLLS